MYNNYIQHSYPENPFTLSHQQKCLNQYKQSPITLVKQIIDPQKDIHGLVWLEPKLDGYKPRKPHLSNHLSYLSKSSRSPDRGGKVTRSVENHNNDI